MALHWTEAMIHTIILYCKVVRHCYWIAALFEVSLAAISIVSEDFDAASRVLSHFERAFSRY